MKSKYFFLLVVVGIFIGININAQVIYVPQSAPYTNDAYTLLLEHFDGSTGGSVNGPVTYTNGVFGQAVHLNSGSWISWNLGALPQGTVEFWGNLDTISNALLRPPNTPRLIGSGYSPFYASTYGVELSPTNTPWSSYHNGPSDGYIWIPQNANPPFPPAQIITTNTWHHYATTWGSQGFHFYVDGFLVATDANTSAQDPSTSWWCIGGQSADGPAWGADDFNGAIDELRISDIQRVFAPAPSLQVIFIKAFTVDYQNLLIGSNYQAQESSDLENWTNWGVPFTATSTYYTNTDYERIANWNQLFFRLVLQ